MGKRLKNNRAFTLLEVLLVVAIIVVLTAVAIPTFTNQIEKSRNITDVYNAKAMVAAIQAYYATHPDELDDLTEACESAPRGYIQISVGPYGAVNYNSGYYDTAIAPQLAQALYDAGLIKTTGKSRYTDITAQSKINWIGYYLAVTTYENGTPTDRVHISVAGVPKGSSSVHSYHSSSFFWPVSKDTTGISGYFS